MPGRLARPTLRRFSGLSLVTGRSLGSSTPHPVDQGQCVIGRPVAPPGDMLIRAAQDQAVFVIRSMGSRRDIQNLQRQAAQFNCFREGRDVDSRRLVSIG
ncbi:MAG: hypothetical protein Ct9H300mP16_11310 [Pseudomonadota bacterium]|nr:MAG: hypothetical protein Ct9H300mP16_11310 [Pseudomonadota bacterium]